MKEWMAQANLPREASMFERMDNLKNVRLRVMF